MSDSITFNWTNGAHISLDNAYVLDEYDPNHDVWRERVTRKAYHGRPTGKGKITYYIGDEPDGYANEQALREELSKRKSKSNNP